MAAAASAVMNIEDASIFECVEMIGSGEPVSQSARTKPLVCGRILEAGFIFLLDLLRRGLTVREADTA